MVKGNVLDLRLVHHTDGPVQKLFESMQMRGPRQLLQGPTLAELHSRIQQYKHAKLIMEAPIVPNIRLLRNESVSATDRLMQPSSNFDHQQTLEFQLVFATQNNIIVDVFFDRTDFRKNQSIQVKKTHSDFLGALHNQQVRAFDIVRDPLSRQDFFVIGAASPVALNDKQAAQNAVD